MALLHTFERAANLLLLAALATFVSWLIGCLAQACGWIHYLRVNSSNRTPDYSTVFLGRLIAQYVRGRLPRSCLQQAHHLAEEYLLSVSVP